MYCNICVVSIAKRDTFTIVHSYVQHARKCINSCWLDNGIGDMFSNNEFCYSIKLGLELHSFNQTF